MIWKVNYHYSQGIYHKKKGITCQDYANYHLLEEKLIIGAVADGAGSAKYADIGARLAVDIIIDYLKRFSYKSSILSTNLFPLHTQNAEKIFSNALKQEVIPRLQQEAQQRNCSINEFACTLICFIVTPDCIIAMQIGDGFLVVRLEHEEYQLLLKPEKGEFINETTFITSQKSLSKININILHEKIRFICASTDGLEKVAIRFSDWTPHPPFFKPLEAYLEQTHNPEKNKEYLENFLNSERLNSRTDDDKTLLLCLYDSV